MENFLQKIVSFFDAAAEICNFGIVFQILGTFGVIIPHVGLIPVICDALIYFFRAFSNVIVALGESLGVKFPDRPQEKHEHHLLIDTIAVLCFLGAVSVIVSSIFSPLVILPFAGWALGLAGVTCSWVINHRQNVTDLKSKNAPQADIDAAIHSRNLYAGILLFVAISLLCGTGAALCPPLAPFLLFTAKLAGGCLGIINVGRLINFCAPSVFSSLLGGMKKLWRFLHGHNDEQPAAIDQVHSSLSENSVLRKMVKDSAYDLALGKPNDNRYIGDRAPSPPPPPAYEVSVNAHWIPRAIGSADHIDSYMSPTL